MTKDNVLCFLRKLMPFLLTLGLWRLSVAFWNPAGILALIPIFYYSFINKKPGFSVYALLFCFLLDYNFNTLLFWTSLYCFTYAVIGFQNFIDLSKLEKNGTHAFMIFLGTGIFLLTCINLNLSNLIRSVWLFAWVTTLYIPTTALIKKVSDD